MKVGDLVQHFLTEQLGTVLEVRDAGLTSCICHVLWTTQGESLFGPGTKEWCGVSSIDLVGAQHEAR
tara:strand:+ start:385 stop:585 length:201 start_codon:yes stop_codon:yes gene_type:complete